MGGARIIGDIRDPDSQISRLLAEHHDDLMVLRPEQGTSPHVFYLGMDERFVTRPLANPAIWDVRDNDGKEIGYEFAGH